MSDEAKAPVNPFQDRVYLIVNITLKSKDSIDDFKKGAKPLVHGSQGEKGCLQYLLVEDKTNPLYFQIFEEYVNQAALEFHRTTDHFKGFGTTKEACVESIKLTTSHRIY